MEKSKLKKINNNKILMKKLKDKKVNNIKLFAFYFNIMGIIIV